MEGYFLNGRQGCTPCISSCKECKDANTCTKCYDGFEFDPEKGQCTVCNLDCVGVRLDYRPYPYNPILPIYSASAASPGAYAYRGGGGSGEAVMQAATVSLPTSITSKSDEGAKKGDVTDDTDDDEDDSDDGETDSSKSKAKQKKTKTAEKADAAKSEQQSKATKSDAKADASKAGGEIGDSNKTNSTDAN